MDRKEWKDDVDLLPSITSGLQFGFKQKMSTTFCTGAVKNIVSRYLHENSAIFACFLDASKAFDLVNHKILLWWGNTSSESFPVSNGVRHGGVATFSNSFYHLH